MDGAGGTSSSVLSAWATGPLCAESRLSEIDRL